MKKLIQTVLILIPVALAATGCDFFRKLAGRPTSDQIAAMAEAIRLEESARIADSLRKALAEPQEDSAATTPAPATPATQAASTPTASSPVTATTTPAAAAPAPAGDLKRFYVVMASFGNSANANKYASILEAKGYPATILKRGSYQVVAVCGTDDEAAIKQSFDEIRRQDFCPQGVWIIDRNGK
ncbi:MAG: SPOR domain-containing protein [Bacteroidales bacterium]|nr:SPOR domain-containing protein [Bacteroidales bacterium]